MHIRLSIKKIPEIKNYIGDFTDNLNIILLQQQEFHCLRKTI
ncbi:hypothetical protein ASZ90_004546 [hydrocarbon metagenome]|uniref:Uncharacterized protein n=1 Tax=hydrocarbon metagenome TaxID=938273 RepID=A0A0W8FXQ6_9ZZZZ